MGTNFERYRVKAGTKVDLGKEPTRGDDAYGGDKDARLKDWPSNPEFQRRDIDNEYFGE